MPQVRSASSEQAIGWIKSGWEMFKRAPGPWVAIIVIYVVLAVVADLIPVVGGLVFALIAPVLTVGILEGCRAQHAGGSLEIQHLFSGFSSPRLTQLIVLGAISLGAVIVLGVIGGLGAAGAIAGGAAVSPATVGVGGLLMAVVVLAALIVVAAALWFAPPLVAFHGVQPLAAVKLSLEACLKNILSMLVWSLIALLLMIVGAIPLGLGLLVVLPMLFAGYYMMYLDVFGEPPAAPLPAA